MTEIRVATRKDLEAVRALVRAGVAENALLRRSKKDLATCIREQRVMVAVDDANVIGLGILDFYSKRLSEMRTLFVRYDYRKSGVGKRLVDALVEKARQLRVKELMMITAKEKKAWFTKHGFAEEAHGFKVALFKKL
jgi:amino-acid N-acetyltransferase